MNFVFKMLNFAGVIHGFHPPFDADGSLGVRFLLKTEDFVGNRWDHVEK